MQALLYLLLSTVILPSSILPSSLGAQVRAEAPTGTAFYAVSYVEIMPSSKGTAVAALKEYRNMSRADDGYVRMEVFEQIGRTGHFAIVETWRDQKALDAHGMHGHAGQFRSKLEPIRVSDYDQRPYKTLAAGSAPAAANGQMIYIVAHVDIAGQQTAAPDMLKQLADASRRDEGNLQFDVLQHAMRANHFTVVEAWQNQKALDAHAAAEHTKRYRDTLGPMSGSPLDENTYKIVE